MCASENEVSFDINEVVFYFERGNVAPTLMKLRGVDFYVTGSTTYNGVQVALFKPKTNVSERNYEISASTQTMAISMGVVQAAYRAAEMVEIDGDELVFDGSGWLFKEAFNRIIEA